VCLCACLSCLSASISPEPHARSLPNFCACCYGRGAVLLRQGDEIPRGKGNFGVFVPTDNALNSIAIGTRTKTAEPVKIQFGMITQVDSVYHSLDGEGAIWGGRSGPLQSNGTLAAASLPRSLQKGSFNRQ